jgi:pilus assembly protein Flp/PilA
MLQLISSLIADEDGATAVEYSLIATLIAVAAITAMTAMGVSLQSMFVAVSDHIDGALQAGGGTN